MTVDILKMNNIRLKSIKDLGKILPCLTRINNPSRHLKACKNRFVSV